MANLIEIDPWTEQNLEKRTRRSFLGILETIKEDSGDNFLDEMEPLDIAELFFTNGYIQGAIDVVKDQDFRDDIELMNDEIEYQKK